jgi:hypothetical protein
VAKADGAEHVEKTGRVEKTERVEKLSVRRKEVGKVEEELGSVRGFVRVYQALR